VGLGVEEKILTPPPKGFGYSICRVKKEKEGCGVLKKGKVVNVFSKRRV